jgi:hypothetical protein
MDEPRMNSTSLLAGKHESGCLRQRRQPKGKEGTKIEISPQENANPSQENNRGDNRLESQRQTEDPFAAIPFVAGSLFFCR